MIIIIFLQFYSIQYKNSLVYSLLKVQNSYEMPPLVNNARRKSEKHARKMDMGRFFARQYILVEN